MNLLAIVRRVWIETAKQGFGPAALIADATKDSQRIANWVNDAYQDLARQRDRRWKWLRVSATPTLAASQTSYTLAALGLATWDSLRIASQDYRVYLTPPGGSAYPLKWAPFDLMRNYLLSASAGASLYWSISDAGSLVIGPAPAVLSVVHIDGLLKQPDLILDADTPLMPTQHHMYLVWRALVEASVASGSAETLARATANADATYRDLIEDQAETIVWQQ